MNLIIKIIKNDHTFYIIFFIEKIDCILVFSNEIALTKQDKLHMYFRKQKKTPHVFFFLWILLCFYHTLFVE